MFMKRIAKKIVPVAVTKRMSGKKKKDKTKDRHPEMRSRAWQRGVLRGSIICP